MKKISPLSLFTVLFALLMQATGANAQCTTITLQQGVTKAVGAHIDNYYPNQNLDFTTYTDFDTWQWTEEGTPIEDVSLLKFDLSQIPAGSVVVSAYLSLYADSLTPYGYAGQPTYGSNNASYLYWVQSSWDPATVTWNTQPSITTNASEVLLPQSTSADENYLNLDLVDMTQYWVDNPATNYGMMLRILTDNYYNSMIFCSPGNANSAKWPKLQICYIPPACNAQASFTQQNTGGQQVQFTNTSTDGTQGSGSPTSIIWSDNFNFPAGGSDNNNAGQNWSGNTLTPGGTNENDVFDITNFWIIDSATAPAGICGTGNKLYVTSNFGPPYVGDYYYSGDYSDIYDASPNISTLGDTGMTLSFTWRCKGVAGRDYGLVGLSSNGGASFTWLPTKYQGSTACQNASISIPANYDNLSNFKIAFRFIAGNSNQQTDPPFEVDNIVLANNGSSTSNAAFISHWVFYNSTGAFDTSNSTNPLVTYTGQPPYSAMLIITDSICSDTITEVVTISANTCTAIASFTQQTVGANQVQFTNTSTDTRGYNSYWAFYNSTGLFSSSTAANPLITLTGNAPYRAYLLIIDSVCSDTASGQFNATTPACNAQASFAQQNTSGSQVQFTNTSTDTHPYTTNWVFYNSTGAFLSSNSNNPLITFNGLPPYSAMLTVADSTCSDTMSQAVNVNVATTKCITLQYGNTKASGAEIGSYSPNSGSDFTTYDQLFAEQWTVNSIPAEARALLEYDLSQIPANSVIVRANLSLYADNNADNGYLGQPTYGNNNASYLYPVTSAWNPATVTWNGQPATTTSNDVLLPQSVNTDEDYLNFNVSGVVQGWVNNPSGNYGLLLRMITTNYYNSMIFCSSSYADSTKWPKLEICYIPAPVNNCITVIPGPSDGIHAHITDNHPTQNFGHDPEFMGYDWTILSVPVESRGLMKFDLSSLVPIGATITSATLNLYADTTSPSSYVGEPTYGSANTCNLKLVTEPWDRNSVTWNTQPPATATGEVNLPQSTNYTENYLGVDVTGFVQGWANDPNTNYGMLLQMAVPQYYNAMIFCSSDYPDSTLRPSLQICYIPRASCGTIASFTYQHLGSGVVQFNNTSSSDSGYYSSWVFYNSDGIFANSNEQNPTITYTGGEPYYAQLTVSDSIFSTCVATTDSLIDITTCVTLTFNPFNAFNAVITTVVDTNLGGVPDFLALQWEADNIPFEARSLMKFNLNQIPTGATIVSSMLNLYADSASVNGYIGLPMYGNTNSSDLLEVTSPWAQNTVTWLNQPTTTSNNSVLLGQTRGSSNYPLIGISKFVQDWVNNPAQNYGMMIKMITQNFDNSMIFCSNDYPDSTRWPSLQVCYIAGQIDTVQNDTLCGFVFDDFNNNGVYDSGDVPAARAAVLVDGTIYYTDTTGYYNVAVGAGLHQIGVVPPYGWSQTAPLNPNTYSITTSTNQHICGFDFGISNTATGVNDLGLSSNMVIFPNPLNGPSFKILTPDGFEMKNASVQLEDMLGREVSVQYLQVQQKLVTVNLLGSLTPGVYVVVLANDSKRLCGRLSVVR